MRPLTFLGALLGLWLAVDTAVIGQQKPPAKQAEPSKDVPWMAQAEILRRGPMVERVGGFEDANSPITAFTAAVAPPADDSHKWLFTMVTTKGCAWCEKLRSDFLNDPKLRAWVDTSDYTKSWGHWQVIQIEDQSQAWRWKDYKPTVFPTLIVQPPLNGSWGDPHTIVYAKQGYVAPAKLDAELRAAIQLYATKAFPKHLARAIESEEGGISEPGFQQGGGANTGDWKPPVAPPSPLPPLPNVAPATPPSTFPPLDQTPATPKPATPEPSQLFAQLIQALIDLLGSLLGGQGFGNILLLAMVVMWVLEWMAPQTATKLDDEALAFLREFYNAAKNNPPADPPAPAA